MTDDFPQNMPEYVLEFPDERHTPPDDESAGMYAVLSNTLLFENIFWYCRLRWMVITALVLFGSGSYIPGWFDWMHLHARLHWPFIIAGILAVSNGIFLAHANTIRATMPGRAIRFNMWSQIVLDLLFLTGVVHFAGSLVTPAPFIYLFHIVLACIFFTRIQSFLVTIFACIAFVSCVSLEISGLLPPSSVFGLSVPHPGIMLDPLRLFIPIFSVLGIWLVVWHLVSHLSDLARQRDIELIETNRQLSEKQEEEKKRVMWLTHELKAPLAAIDANILLMKEGYGGILPDKALEVVERISARSHKLGSEIQEMLQLATIRAAAKDTLRREPLDLSVIISGCLAQLQPSADERNIRLEPELSPASFAADEEHMKMLFMNVISNAITYSRSNGAVRILCLRLPESGPLVVVEDRGIGIAPGKLGKIFDEYYHTTEAVEHNRKSTGIGLAIVKQIAQTYRLSIRVASQPQVGTRFEIRFY